MVKFLKFCYESLIATLIDVTVFKCRKICPTGNQWNRALFACQQKFGSLSDSNCRYCADRAQNLPGPVTNIWLTLFQILSISVHFRRSHSRTRRHRSFAPRRVFSIYGFGRIISARPTAEWRLRNCFEFSKQCGAKCVRRLTTKAQVALSQHCEANRRSRQADGIDQVNTARYLQISRIFPILPVPNALFRVT